MDQQASARWLETLKSENRTKLKWQEKYLTAEQQQREQAELDEAMEALKNSKQTERRSISERDAMEMRLAFLDREEAPPEPEKTLPHYEVLRQRVAAEVARTRQRSHRYTGDLSCESMLKDIGPGLWISINPSYAPMKATSTTHRTHYYDKNKGWADRVRAAAAARALLGSVFFLAVRDGRLRARAARAPPCARGGSATRADRRVRLCSQVDKEHHLKMNDFMAHAEKTLQLGESPFVSGGMKLSKK